MVMRWNKEEEGSSCCVVDGVVIVVVDGVNGVVVAGIVTALDVLRSCGCAGFGLLGAGVVECVFPVVDG